MSESALVMAREESYTLFTAEAKQESQRVDDSDPRIQVDHDVALSDLDSAAFTMKRFHSQ